MSVARTREVVARLRAAGVNVVEAPGCYTRGNGQTSAYEGFSWHHTATAFANSNLGVLINGRVGLSGPLCNSCGWADGTVGIIAAHPANHAGASGGYNTTPLPRTSAFNKYTWGHEIIYPGTQPMTAAQYKTACILAKICTDIFGYGDINRAKGHAETSITGKWDPGYAPSKTVDLGRFRADARNSQVPTPIVRKEEDMALNTDTFEPTYNKAAGATLAHRRHTYVAPTNSKLGTIYSNTWLTIKCAWGSMEEVYVQCVDATGKSLYNNTFKDVQQNVGKINVQAPDGTDQYNIQVISNAPYSVCIEAKVR
jgi:hypothetical protein